MVMYFKTRPAYKKISGVINFIGKVYKLRNIGGKMICHSQKGKVKVEW